MEAVRRRKIVAERRAQSLRAEGRRVQMLLRQFQLIPSHRGGQLSRLGVALLAALTAPVVVQAE